MTQLKCDITLIMNKKLEWEDKYSVGVVEIDNQHKHLFSIVNELLDLINLSVANKDSSIEEHIGNVINSLIEYKKLHFDTEEKYFKEFNYEEAEDHIAQHKEFSVKLNLIKEKYSKVTVEFAYEVIDFLEDWLIKHLMFTDQKYVTCFHEHGLK